MEVTNRQIVSDIIGQLRSMNIDDRISNRLVLSRAKDKTRTMIKQDLDSRRLFKITNIWKRIKCLHMKSYDPMECGFDIPHTQCFMKSTKKIPQSFDSNYGTIIKVFTLDGSKEYKQTSFSEYKDIKNREFNDPTVKYFWLDDQYVYIPDSEVEAVSVVGLFERPEEVDKLNEEKGSECAKPLDQYFPCPEHLLDPVKKDTIIEFAKTYKSILEDTNPNQSNK